MKIFHFFFALLTGFLLLVVVLWFVVPPEGAMGYVNEAYPTMRNGGASLSSKSSTKWLSFLFGLFILGVFGMCLAIGYRKRGQIGAIRKWLIIGIVSYIGVYTMMVISYWNYIDGVGETTYFLGVPAPTAWMLYGVWFFPLFFTILYIRKFDEWVITPEELERFHELVAENKEKGIQ